MKKAWTYKRKNVKGWWVGWYESGKRKAKALPSKALAEHFRQMKYAQLNSDVFTGTVTVDWSQMREEYAQNTIDKFILDRGKEIKRSTLNKDITNLKAFVNWGRENRYMNGDIKLKLLREDERPVISLSTTQIKQLLSASKPYPRLRMRILLALSTGLRRGDIESWQVSELDFEKSYVTTRSTETKKSMGSRPLPVPIMAELKKYISGFDPKQEKIFNRPFSQCRWTQIRDKLGLRDFKFHDLRKTFGSVLAQNGVSTAVVQRLLEHSSSDPTNKVYTNVDPVLRHAIDTIPAGEWL